VKIPRYWFRATADGQQLGGGAISISCWRSSDTSQDEAQQLAESAARQAVARLVRGESLNRYTYGQLPLREEVLNRLNDPQGAPFLAVTRNNYGAVILNTARVAFLDLDFPPAAGSGMLQQLFARWLGKPVPDPDAECEAEIQQRLDAFAAAHPGAGFRIYRTAAGLRAIATHELFDPGSPATLDMLEALGTDPLYVRLCKVQNCFRARLTPKPWRCGCIPNPVRWPRADAEQQAQYERWDADYSAAQDKYATCRLLGAVGAREIQPDVYQVLQLHDRMTRCEEPLPLA
jgi:hypothetical protein